MATGPWNKQKVGIGFGFVVVPLLALSAMVATAWVATEAFYFAFPEYAPRKKRSTDSSDDSGKIKNAKPKL